MNSSGVAVWEGMPVARSLEEFAAGVRRISNFKREFEFRLGQWLVQNRNKHGDLIWQWADELPYTHSQLSNFMWVAQSIGEQYTPEIPWTWWQSMAAIPAKDRDPIITRALAKEISRDQIRALGHKNGCTPTATQMAGIPSELETMLDALGMALVGAGKLVARRMKGEAVDTLLRAAMDDVGAEWAKLDGKL